MGINIGPIRIDDPVILAPMSGVSDMPFRRLVKRSGAGLVVSEMPNRDTKACTEMSFVHQELFGRD